MGENDDETIEELQLKLTNCPEGTMNYQYMKDMEKEIVDLKKENEEFKKMTAENIIENAKLKSDTLYEKMDDEIEELKKKNEELVKTIQTMWQGIEAGKCQDEINKMVFPENFESDDEDE